MKTEIKLFLGGGAFMLAFFLFCNWFWSINESLLETIKMIGFTLIVTSLIFRAKEDHKQDNNPNKA